MIVLARKMCYLPCLPYFHYFSFVHRVSYTVPYKTTHPPRNSPLTFTPASAKAKLRLRVYALERFIAQARRQVSPQKGARKMGKFPPLTEPRSGLLGLQGLTANRLEFAHLCCHCLTHGHRSSLCSHPCGQPVPELFELPIVF